jgi:hypothetical protein
LIVTFALEAVGALDAEDRLPPAELVSGIVPALLSRTTGREEAVEIVLRIRGGGDEEPPIHDS